MRILKVFLFFIFITAGCNNSDSEDIIISEPDIDRFLDDWTYKVYPKYGNSFDIAEFRLWVPQDINTIKAILILTHSYNSNGLGLANSKEWQEYAKEEHLAILAVYFKTFDDSSPYYAEASGGSGDALVKALEMISKKNDLSNISNLPFVMRGYSAGGVFSTNFSNFKPDRVIAFANIRGGNIDDISVNNKSIPCIMLAGEYDNQLRNKAIKNAVLSNRVAGGVWCYALEPEVDHYGNLGRSDQLVRDFFSIALDKRLDEKSIKLQSISEESGWLGNHTTKEIYPFHSYPENKNEASFLINEDFALKWKAYQLN